MKKCPKGEGYEKVPRFFCMRGDDRVLYDEGCEGFLGFLAGGR
jgi:hypothetical protein